MEAFVAQPLTSETNRTTFPVIHTNQATAMLSKISLEDKPAFFSIKQAQASNDLEPSMRQKEQLAQLNSKL